MTRKKPKPMNTAAAIKWALSNPDIHTTIPGMTQFDQLDLNVKMLSDITLTEQEKKDILISQLHNQVFFAQDVRNAFLHVR